MKPITLDTATDILLKKLAEESETTRIGLVEKLIKKEDERRHVTVVPFEGEKRFRCTCAKCFETQTKPTGIEDEN